jgi:cellulose synthase (UDP-forming)
VDAALAQARADLASGMTAQEITGPFQLAVDRASRQVVTRDLDQISADLASLGPLPVEADADRGVVVDEGALAALSRRDLSPLGAMLSLRALVRALDIDRSDEALPVMPLSTIAVTEDLATAMRLHAQGWRSVYHGEVLAYGLAPEDLGSALKQRLRWAQGSLQVLLKDNPLTVPGLTPGQRLMYLDTMLSYLQGFAAVAYLASPALYLLFGVSPVRSFSSGLFWRLIPYLLANQALLVVVAWGVPVWRGQQYTIALFPLWIQATVNAVRSTLSGRSATFQVTPKRRQEGVPWRAIIPQLLALAVLAVAAAVGILRLVVLPSLSVAGVLANLVWDGYDLVVLSVIVRAALYRGPGWAAAAPPLR